MFQRILVPLDGSQRAEQAIPVAAHIARNTGGVVVLLRVVTVPIGFAWYPMEPEGTMEQAIDVDMAEAAAYLTAVAHTDALAGIETNIEVLPGEPALSISPVAHSYQADLIVMCSHGETGLKRWILGSVAQKIARHSSIPVLILREGAGIPTNFHPEGIRPVRILVPLDGSPLAEAALAPAAHLARALSTPAQGALHLVRILPLPDVKQGMQDDVLVVASPRQEEHGGRSEVVAAARAFTVSEAETYLQTVAQQLRQGDGAGETISNIQVTSSVVVHTDIAGTLLTIAETGQEQRDVAEEASFQGSDVIAMATHGRGGLGRWLVGSVTERVLEGTRLPLLIVRPQIMEKKQEQNGATIGSKDRESGLQSWVGLL